MDMSESLDFSMLFCADWDWWKLFKTYQKLQRHKKMSKKMIFLYSFFQTLIKIEQGNPKKVDFNKHLSIQKPQLNIS